jgi:hypothetical protein
MKGGLIMVNSSTNKLIAAFVLLILGIVFISQISVIGSGVTTYSRVTDESIALVTNGTDLNTSGMVSSTYQIVNSPSGWKVLDCPITSFSLTNSSGSALVEDTDFTFTESNGTLTLLRTVLTKSTLYPINVSLVDYAYCGDDYMNLGWGRTGINLVPGFFAIAMLLISVGLFYSVAKENGIIS